MRPKSVVFAVVKKALSPWKKLFFWRKKYLPAYPRMMKVGTVIPYP